MSKGNHMDPKKFDPKKIDKLNSPVRMQSEDPNKIAEILGLEERFTVVDIGAGTGFYELPFSRRLGNGGKVYALDIAQEMVDWMGKNIPEEALIKIEPAVMTENSIPLPDNCADVVFSGNVLHELHNPVDFT
jgi:ubiquinone/menaquinone biosynthesis C-methylase UbiE